MAFQVSTHRFTVEEFHRMAEVGILSDDDRVDLLEGEIIEMTPIGSQHAACVARLTQEFESADRHDCHPMGANPGTA